MLLWTIWSSLKWMTMTAVTVTCHQWLTSEYSFAIVFHEVQVWTDSHYLLDEENYVLNVFTGFDRVNILHLVILLTFEVYRYFHHIIKHHTLILTRLAGQQLHVVSREEAEDPVGSESLPPAGVNLFYVGDDVAGVKRDLWFVRCNILKRLLVK